MSAIYFIWRILTDIIEKNPVSVLVLIVVIYMAWKLFCNHLHHIDLKIDDIKNQTNKNYKKISLVNRKLNKFKDRLLKVETKVEERTSKK